MKKKKSKAILFIINQEIIKYENRYIINSSYQLIISHRILLNKITLSGNNKIFYKIQDKYIIPFVFQIK
jgi:hypothetical protein